MTDEISDEIESLSGHHGISEFDCGETFLDNWLKSRALRNQDTGDSRSFVATHGRRVIGFYALATAAAARTDLPGNLRRNAPDPVPLLLLGQLAVDRSFAGQGLGTALLRDAVLRAARSAEHVGFRALATHALNDQARQIYERFGFRTVPDSRPMLMVLSRQQLLTAMRAALS